MVFINRNQHVAEHKHIVCGRGSKKYNSKGNKTLRNLVGSHLALYIDETTTRSEKSKLVEKVCKQLIAAGMVFVKKISSGGRGRQGDAICIWEELSYAQARAKVAHRFRDAARRVYAGEDTLPFSSPSRLFRAPPNTSTTDVGCSDSVDSSILSSPIVLNDKEIDSSPRPASSNTPRPRQGMLRPRRAAQAAIKKVKKQTTAPTTHGANRSRRPHLKKKRPLSAVPPSVVISSHPSEELFLVPENEEYVEPRMVVSQLTIEDMSSIKHDVDDMMGASLPSKNSPDDEAGQSPTEDSLMSNVFLAYQRQAERDGTSPSFSDEDLLVDMLESDGFLDSHNNDDGEGHGDENDESTPACPRMVTAGKYIEELEQIILGRSFPSTAI
jgi:hypothetical protein